MIDTQREVGRIFKHYFVNLNKLDEKNDQFYKDIQALVCCAYQMGYLSGTEDTKKDIEKDVWIVLRKNNISNTKKTEVEDFLKRTSHIQRDEK